MQKTPTNEYFGYIICKKRSKAVNEVQEG